MAIKSAVSLQAANKNPSNKRMLVMLLIVAILAVWSFFKNNTDDSDAVELADSSAVSTPENQPKTQSKKDSLLDERLQENNQKNTGSMQNISGDKRLIAWSKLQREPLFNQPHNVFKVHSWLVIPKLVKTKPLPPPPPVAPPAPFTYMGKLENSPQGTQLFLLRNGKLYTALMGQKIDAQWRLDGDDLNNIQLTYLPLNLPQVLSKTAQSFDSIGQTTIDTPSAEMNL